MSEYLKNHYENYDEDGRLATGFGLVEFLTTMRYIEKYLSPDCKILEIGAGTGRYSHTLARMGYEVEAIELLEHNITIFEQNTQPGEKITITQGNALDLFMFDDDIFDVTLVLGPMYHLYTEADKHRAISEALRVTKPGGIVFVAYCISDPTILDDGFKRKRFDVADFINNGMIDPTTFATNSKPEDIFEMVRKEDVDRLMADFNVKPLHYVATDMFARHFRDVIADMDEETFALYLRHHFVICERADMVGLSHHTLDIFRKN